MAPPPARIVVSGLTLDYVNPETGVAHRAVEGLDLAIAAQEFLSVCGPSGCGKSTLLAAIAGFLRPTAGTITMDGQAVTGPSAERGVVFQEYALLPWMTVLDNAALGLKLRGVPKKERYEEARRFLALCGPPPRLCRAGASRSPPPSCTSSMDGRSRGRTPTDSGAPSWGSAVSGARSGRSGRCRACG